MILGVLSDTHGNRKFLEQARKLAVNHFGASVLIHLGDNYSDAEVLMLKGTPVWAVPGLWCAAYHSPSIPRARLEGAGTLLIHFAHAEQDLEPESVERAQIILTGHTHRYRLDFLDGKIWMNRGIKAVPPRSVSSLLQPTPWSAVSSDSTARPSWLR